MKTLTKLQEKTLSEWAAVPMPYPLRHSILFQTAIGVQWVETRFTALSLLYGRPPKTDPGTDINAFNDAFNKIFGIDLLWTQNQDTIIAWIDAYAEWYAREEHAAIRSDNG